MESIADQFLELWDWSESKDRKKKQKIIERNYTIQRKNIKEKI